MAHQELDNVILIPHVVWCAMERSSGMKFDDLIKKQNRRDRTHEAIQFNTSRNILEEVVQVLSSRNLTYFSRGVYGSAPDKTELLRCIIKREGANAKEPTVQQTLLQPRLN